MGFLAGCATAFAVSPYSVLDFSAFRSSMAYETSLARGTLSVPYTLQFLGTTPYLFFLQNLPWHLGPLLPLISGAGMLAWPLAMLRGRSPSAAFPLWLFAVVYFSYVGGMFARFIRYLLPLYPALILAAGDDYACFSGDLLHSPIQFAHPQWNSAFCGDPRQAEVSRREMMAWGASHHAQWFTGHFAGPSCGWLEKDKQGDYRWREAGKQAADKGNSDE